MLKSSILILLLSALVILLLHQVGFSLGFLAVLHKIFLEYLNKIFASGQIGILLKQTMALFLVPLLIALVPTAVYYATARRSFAYYQHVLWTVWVIMVVIIAIH
ncbi:MAG: hypothetical protein AAGG80_03035 [Pseudomonadota bacterium]